VRIGRQAVAGILVLLIAVFPATLSAAQFKPDWDQAASIRGAAERIAKLHRARGPDGVYKFIDACYKTHSLAETYREPFESCIVQDYLETKMLIEMYVRMRPQAVKRLNLPPPQILANAMGRRIVAALTQYKMNAAYGEQLKKLVDKHGVPVFFKIVFPAASREIEQRKREQGKQ
jgi:hypothetical protein